jgi:short-subunit dehydrogenase
MGFAIARDLARCGYFVVITTRSKEKGEIACDRLRNQGCTNVDYEVFDATTAAKDAAGLLIRVEAAHGFPDVLVNNAGLMTEGSWNEEAFNESMQTNFYGPMHLTNVVLPGMLKRERRCI